MDSMKTRDRVHVACELSLSLLDIVDLVRRKVLAVSSTRQLLNRAQLPLAETDLLPDENK